MQYMFMPLKRYAEFSGRSRRMEFWMWFLFVFLVEVAAGILMLVLGGSDTLFGGMSSLTAPPAALTAVWIATALFGLAILIPNIAVTVRRLHDTNRSGWWILAPFIPYFVGLIAALGFAGADEMSSGLMVAAGLVTVISMLAAVVLWIVVIVFMFLEGTRGPNRFGPDPKGRPHEEVFA